jgi:hypothetical protein
MRKEKKYHYIYKTVNVLNGKYYLGMHSTDDLNDGYLGSGTRLRYSINKHGKENHNLEILEYCKSREELKSREEEIVNLNEIAKVDCMNLKVGGYGGFTDETHRLKFMEGREWGILKGAENAKIKLTGKDFSDNHKKAIAEGLKKIGHNHNTFEGKVHSEETKLKMRKPKNIGKRNSQYGSMWITNESENKKISKIDSIPEGWRLGRKMKK